MWQPKKSRFQQITDILNRPLYAVGATVEHGLGKSPYEHWYEAALGGLKGEHPVEFMQLTGNPILGFILDIPADPLTWIPYGGLVKLAKATRLPSLAVKIGSKLATKYPSVAKIGGALSAAASKGFMDKFYDIKRSTGYLQAIKQLKQLNVSDDLVRAAKAGSLTDDMLRGLNPKAIRSLKKIDTFSKAMSKTLQLPREVFATEFELMDEYASMMSKYGKWLKEDPQKASLLYEAMELAKPIDIKGKWGLSDDFLNAVRKLGVSDDEIAAIQRSVERPIVQYAARQMELDLGDTFHVVDKLPEYKHFPSPFELPEFQQIMDVAVSKLNPIAKDIFKRASYVYGELYNKALEKKILTESLVQKFAQDLGVAHIAREPLPEAFSKLRKLAQVKRITIEDDLVDKMKNIENYFTDLFNKGVISEDIFNAKVSSLKGVAEKIAKAKLEELYGGDDLAEFIFEMKNFIKEIPNAKYRVGAQRILNQFQKAVGDIRKMRKTVGTIASIENLAGETLFEKNLAKLLFKQELKLKTALIYQQYLEDMVKNSGGLISRYTKGGVVPKGYVRISSKGLGDFVVHHDIARAVDETFRIMKGTSDNFAAKVIRAYDKGHGVWKYFTLIPFIKFHFRNLISEFFLNSIAGMSVVDPAYLKAMKVWSKAVRGEPGAVKEYTKFMRAGIVGTGFMRSELQSIKGQVNIAKAIGKIPIAGRPVKGVLEGMERIGSFAEDVPRMAMYYWLKRKGLDYVAKLGFDDIVKAVRKFHPVYDEFTAFEQEFMRRLMPFYSWLRFNLPLHLEMIVKNPKHYAQIERLRKAITTMRGGMLPEDDPYAANYIKQGYAIGWSKRPGVRTYFLLKDWLPQVQVGELFSADETKDLFVQYLTPLKIIPETIWGYDTFRKRKIPAYPGEKRLLLGKKVPAKVYHLISPIRLLKDLNRIFFPDNNTSAKLIDRIIYALYGKSYKVDVNKTRKFLKRTLLKAKSELKYGIRRAQYNKDYKTVKLLNQKIREIDKELVKL